MFNKTTGLAVALLAFTLAAGDSLAATYGAQGSGSSALFYVDTTSWADIHYRLNNGGQLNVRMTVTNGRNQYTVSNLVSGDIIDYSFTYWDTACNCAYDTPQARYTHGSTPVDAGTGDAGTPVDAGTGDAGTPVDAGTGGGGTDAGVSSVVPLFNSSTPLEAALVEETSQALITHVGERVRDRHARESQFQAYDHFLPLYFVNRTFYVDIVDEVAKGGNQITVNLHTVYPHDGTNFRAFFRGINTVAEYWHNGTFARVNDNLYTASVNYNAKEGRAIRVGDRMEIEVGVFLKQPVEGRFNYYSGAWLYIVGSGGIVPFEGVGATLDSYPLPEAGWSGGRTTQNQPYSNEPTQRFMQMALNLAPVNTQTFVEGRRIHHTDFGDGSHSEPGNPVFTEQQNKLGPNYVGRSCIDCHKNNGRGLPPAVNTTLSNFVVKVGRVNGSTVTADPQLGSRLQPRSTSGTPEADVRISQWTETAGKFSDGASYSLRKPAYSFLNVIPTNYSARITPQLVGMGLLEAVPESAVNALADPNDSNGDGISGRMRTVTDPQTGEARLGRFGWKAGTARLRHQIADAFNGDMGVTSSVFKTLDCGSAQTGCSGSSTELSDQDLDKIVRYIALLGVPARRDLTNAQAQRGETLFQSAGCASCHTATLTTSPYHPNTELRGQTIHPYTDLLLHDMGAGLADNLPEGTASGSEWRTPPLWSIGLTAGVSGGEAYLHDGRARTLSEAILWHGGEAEASKQAFVNMSSADRDALIRFLQSL
ncbi:di-heme oxidoredictase family protein [Vitiosangium sp. GDMCC 1.1324]|uniref:di-heme oxidoreductase family protein n=1 Tax=Vitiosangium sp. (strain GDMCC 1.1324) TaxID=2138576 RepID=UPI000D3B35BB|nr:di-heme oxidoredictase family protein [Vitiosangium sp. GDMCC 1.1324]PTL83865.1 thiol oxidoreductase [Vitiosangium sp. GDMCC 1.1324]